jgi:hypothetical protein
MQDVQQATPDRAGGQGSDIHVAPGREQHVAHEAWHVVQQTRGGLAPTLQAGGADVNDNLSLEREADLMGAQALRARDTTVRDRPEGA